MTHPGELQLRRHLAKEPLAHELVGHLEGCSVCAAELERLKEEQRSFEAEIPFERFAAGVERAERELRARPTRARPRMGVLVGAVAAVTLAIVGVQVMNAGEPSSRVNGTRIKGGATVDFVIAGVTGQRSATQPIERLNPGDRLRIGVAGRAYVAALSLDEAGDVSRLYSQKLDESGARAWLPDAVELTGHGQELVVVVLADSPIDVDSLEAQLKQVRPPLERIGPLVVTGDQVHRVFLKP